MRAPAAVAYHLVGDADVTAAGVPRGFRGDATVTRRMGERSSPLRFPRLYNLYRGPKGTRSYLTRKLAYSEVFLDGMRSHLATFRAHPPKRARSLNLCS